MVTCGPDGPQRPCRPVTHRSPRGLRGAAAGGRPGPKCTRTRGATGCGARAPPRPFGPAKAASCLDPRPRGCAQHSETGDGGCMEGGSAILSRRAGVRPQPRSLVEPRSRAHALHWVVDAEPTTARGWQPRVAGRNPRPVHKGALSVGILIASVATAPLWAAPRVDPGARVEIRRCSGQQPADRRAAPTRSSGGSAQQKNLELWADRPQSTAPGSCRERLQATACQCRCRCNAPRGRQPASRRRRREASPQIIQTSVYFLF